MKIQCDVCEAAEAALLCCADEAALCWSCDEKVHAANKLAGKHQRVPLLTPNPAAPATADTSTNTTDQMPTCDICQDKAGYFFCLEDRALLCRNCDVGIHTASPYGSSHQRFLITGVRVALQHYPAGNNITSSSNNSTGNDRSNSSSNNNNHIIPQVSDSSITNKKPWTTPTNFCVDEREGIRAPWMWNEDYEVFDSAEFGQCYGISEPGSSS